MARKMLYFQYTDGQPEMTKANSTADSLSAIMKLSLVS